MKIPKSTNDMIRSIKPILPLKTRLSILFEDPYLVTVGRNVGIPTKFGNLMKLKKLLFVKRKIDSEDTKETIYEKEPRKELYDFKRLGNYPDPIIEKHYRTISLLLI